MTQNSAEPEPPAWPYAPYGIALFVLYKLVMVVGMNIQRYSAMVEKEGRPWYKQPMALGGWIVTIVAPWIIMYPATQLCPLWRMLPWGTVAIFANTFFSAAISGEQIKMSNPFATLAMSGTSFLALFSGRNAEQLTRAALSAYTDAEKASSSVKGVVGHVKGIAASVHKAAAAATGSASPSAIVPEVGLLEEVAAGASRMLLISQHHLETLRQEFSGTNF